MRGLSLIGLMLALVIVGLALKRQLRADPPTQAGPAAVPMVRTPGQAQQVQQQVREALDAATQPRAMPDD